MEALFGQRPYYCIDPEETGRRTAEAVVSVAACLDLELTVDFDGRLSHAQQELAMRQFTGKEHHGTGLLPETERSNAAALGDSWGILRNALPAPAESARPDSDPEALLIVGASGDIMLDHALRVEQWMQHGYSPNQVWYLAGMRPFYGSGTKGDERFIARMGIVPEDDFSETDMARCIIKEIHGGTLTRTAYLDSTVEESTNELGPRVHSHEYYRTPAGKEIVLLNGASIERAGGGRPRHTARSVFQEYFDTANTPADARLHILASYPHAQRIALEGNLTALQHGRRDVTIQAYTSMPPADRLTPAALLSALMPLHRVSQEVVSLDNMQRRLEVVRVPEVGLDTTPFELVLDTIRQRATNALLEIGPPNLGESLDIPAQATLESYLTAILGPMTERRGTNMEPVFENVTARQRFTDLLKEMGVAAEKDIAPDALGITTPWMFFSEGGTATKMDLQLQMLEKGTAKPDIIILGAAKEREIPPVFDGYGERYSTAALLGISPEEVGNSEYEVARQLAMKRVVHTPAQKEIALAYDLATHDLQPSNGQGDFELLGYDEAGKPVILMDMKREYTSTDKTTYKNLGVSGTYDVLANLTGQEALAAYSTEGVNTICFATSTLYAPTRTLGLLEARMNMAQKGERGPAFCLSLYGRGEQAREASLSQMASELRQVMNFVVKHEAAAGQISSKP